jgi:hypothetical protein
MPSLTVKPCAQRHEWNLYLNASMFTSTTALDPVFISEVNATAKVGETIDFVRARAGRADRAPPRRVDGFEETWTKVLYRGQELDQSMSWDEVGLFAARGDADDEDVVVTVVWKEIAAEGIQSRDRRDGRRLHGRGRGRVLIRTRLLAPSETR